MNDWKIGKFLQVTLIVQLVVCVAVILNVPVVRQVIGFIYLSFIPGILLLRVLRIHKISKIDTVLLSVGLSIAFSMFVGVWVNEVYPVAGILNPLSSLPLLTTILSSTLILSALTYIIDRGFSNYALTKMNFHKMDFYKLVLLLVCLPSLSILGATLLMNLGSNLLSLSLIIVISGLIVVGTLSKKMISLRYNPAVLLAVAISLLFLLSFTSAYIIGYDIPLEYYAFKLTETSFRWSSIIPNANLVLGMYNAMLSITILPTTYSIMLNLDGTWIFKVIYPLLFSLVPLALYQIYRKQFGEHIAFLSVFFFVSFNTFFDQMQGLARQMTGELFFVLLILLALDRKIDEWKRVILSWVFGAALIVSHYSLSYIFMFLIFFTCLFLPRTKKVEGRSTLTWYYFLAFFTLAFSWYAFVSASAPLVALTNLGRQISQGISVGFLNPVARTPDITQALGMGLSVSLLHEIGRRIFQGIQFLIVVGFVIVVLKRREIRVAPEYYLMSLFSMVLLLMSIVLPFLASGLEMTRIYHIALIFLAPCLVLGGETLLGWIPKLKRFKLTLVSIVIIAFFIFQSGFVYEVTKDVPTWGALSKDRINPVTNLALYAEYIHVQDVFSARWLLQNNDGMSKIYADRVSNYHVLTSYGMLLPEYQYNYAYLLSNATKNVEDGAYIYLGNLNVAYGKAEGPQPGLLWNVTEISPLLSECDKIYSNGYSDICQKPN